MRCCSNNEKCLNTVYEPEVQNFHITTPADSNVSALIDTGRYILDGETTFEKQITIIRFNGTVSDHIAINVCTSDTPIIERAIYEYTTVSAEDVGGVLSTDNGGILT